MHVCMCKYMHSLRRAIHTNIQFAKIKTNIAHTYIHTYPKNQTGNVTGKVKVEILYVFLLTFELSDCVSEVDRRNPIILSP